MDIENKSGLLFPEDLNQWYAWQRSTNRIGNVKHTIKQVASWGKLSHISAPSRIFLSSRGSRPSQLVVALDSIGATSLKALIEPLAYTDVAATVLSHNDITHHLPGEDWYVEEILLSEALNQLNPQVVLSAGHYLDLGSATFELALHIGADYVVSQHGLNTPFAPPLAPSTHLLAFSQADAEFWISGRTDITYDVVGSQLFWEAAQLPAMQTPDEAAQPIFLGQMHGAELPRYSYAQAGYTFCKETGARYRPHPNEKDKLSVLTHALWDKMGIEIDRGREPLNTLTNPVVSIFSTGVLEAAIRGIPAWVYHPNPPAWVREFWDRYSLSEWGEAPTPAPAVPSMPPAQAIAQYLEEKLK